MRHSDVFLWTLGLVLGAGLLFAFGYAMHQSSVRSDAIRAECVKQGRLWIYSGSICVGAER